MDFVRSYFFTNATLTSCPLFFILSSLLGGLLLLCCWIAPTQKWWQNEKKWATGQSCIHKKVTSYKIHTLGGKRIYRVNKLSYQTSSLEWLILLIWSMYSKMVIQVIKLIDFSYKFNYLYSISPQVLILSILGGQLLYKSKLF